MPRYLFPCPACSQSFPVATRHAGQSIACVHCEAAVDIPRLGDLRQLPAESTEPVKSSRSTSGGLKGWLFSTGLVLAAVAAVAGFALLKYSNSLDRDIAGYTEQVEVFSAERIEEMDPAELWDWWTSSTQDELLEWREHPSLGSKRQGEILTSVAYGVFGLSGVGVLILLSSFLVKSNKS